MNPPVHWLRKKVDLHLVEAKAAMYEIFLAHLGAHDAPEELMALWEREFGEGGRGKWAIDYPEAQV